LTPPNLGTVALSTEVDWACGHKGVSLIGNIGPGLTSDQAGVAISALRDGCSRVPCWLCRVGEREKSPPEDPLFVQRWAKA
jgi:hypothetical protein